jgi:hypothetical protein
LPAPELAPGIRNGSKPDVFRSIPNREQGQV